MHSRKYKTDPAVLGEQIKTVLRESSDTRYQHKLEMVSLVLAGMTPSVLSTYSGDSQNAITGWVKTADEQGIEALRESLVGNSGRHAQLSADQIQEIRDLYLNDPSQWTGSKLSEHIEKTYSVHLGQRYCQKMMKKFQNS